MSRAAVYATLILLGIFAGIFIGRALWYFPPDSGPEPIASSFTQADGSVGLTRVPTAAKDMPAPPHIIPKGMTEVRRISVTIKPTPHEAVASTPAGPATSSDVDCPPVRLDLSLVTGKGGSRVIASSPDGAVLPNSLDIPMVPVATVFNHWAEVTSNINRTAYSAIIGQNLHVFGRPVGIGLGLSKPEVGKIEPLVALRFDF